MFVGLELGVGAWLVLWIFVAWWASEWGRSVGWALVGGFFLTPVLWAVVLLVLGRKRDD